MKMTEILPVLLSVATIVVVAVVERHSKAVAAVTATMPIGVPLALWVVIARNQGRRQEVMTVLTREMLVGIVGTVVFLVVAYFAARAGWRLLPVIVAGYAGWGATLGAFALFRS